MNYYISDLHLFCKNQLMSSPHDYDNRPYRTLEDMHEDILANWNKKVTNGDVVYLLGDVSRRGTNEALLSLVARLKGKKILLKGNHDDLRDYRLQQLFFDICDYKELTEHLDGTAYKLVLSHYPILMWNGQHEGSILLYGHTHTREEDIFFQKCIREMNQNTAIRHKGDPEFKAINVGCMHQYVNYEPRSLQELLKAYEVRTI
ncbi:MAG: metallophosphoesterase [Eubacteriales bacterium]|nr:metallophosphoesterase [Eubacteriales bacterium]